MARASALDQPAPPRKKKPIPLRESKVDELPLEYQELLNAAIEESEGARTRMGRLLRSVADETWTFLQDVSRVVRYRDYLLLKAQTFERIRALALSDEFEEIDETARRQIAPDNVRVELRKMPEYKEIRDKLRAEATRRALAKEDPEKWLEEAAPHAKRALTNMLKHGGSSELVMDAAQQVMDRVHPKQARQSNAEVMVVNMPPNFEKTLTKALSAAASSREVKVLPPAERDGGSEAGD